MIAFLQANKNVKNDKSGYRHSSKNKDADSVTANPIYMILLIPMIMKVTCTLKNVSNVYSIIIAIYLEV